MSNFDDELALRATRPAAEAEAEEAALPPSSAGDVVEGMLIDGRYAVLSTLGEGAMGVVYAAHELALDRDVALKTMAPHWAHDASFSRRFLEEARAIAKIRHRNVVQVYTFGQHQGSYYLAMERVIGATLAQILDEHTQRGERLSIHNVLSILRELIDGVSAIHEAGVLHLDLKPSNVVVEYDTGRPVVIDFGVALERVADTQPLAGSPAYMSPEQIRGERLSVHTDIYALGCTAFELLTSRLPFSADDYAQVLEQHLSADPPRMSELRPEAAPFDGVVARALAKRPEERFASCADMRAALEDARALWTRRTAPLDFGPVSTPRAHELRIMVVDDDPSFRRAATRAAKLAFSGKTIRPLPASSGEEALSIATQRMPKLILLDYALPRLDGVDTLSRIRTLPGGHDVRVVVISGAVEEVRWRFSALGVRTFLSKPVDLDELIDALQAIARRSGW